MNSIHNHRTSSLRQFFSPPTGVHNLLILIVFVLMSLPFWVIFQDVLTGLVMRIGWYRQIQELIVPYQFRIVATVLYLLRVPVRAGLDYFEWTNNLGENEYVFLVWNCVGWQTFVLFLVTLIGGLMGKQSLFVKLEIVSVGILGTYFINIARLVLVMGVFYFLGKPWGTLFHNYVSNLLSITWLFGYWWYNYHFIFNGDGEVKE